MELKELKIKEVIENPIFNKKITRDGEFCNGQFMIENYLLNFENGLLENDVWSEDTMSPGQIFPAVQGAGYHEYREHGILTSPDDWRPARVSNGFSTREFWKDGNYIKTEKTPAK